MNQFPTEVWSWNPERPFLNVLHLPCALEPCQNDGTCTDNGDDTYTCTCASTFYGDNCESQSLCELNEPCANGDCTDSEDYSSYSCDCTVGWEGDNCDSQIVEFAGLTSALSLNGTTPADPTADTVRQFLQRVRKLWFSWRKMFGSNSWF